MKAIFSNDRFGFIVSICVLAVRVRNLIGQRTASDWAAYGIGIDNERER